MSEQKKKQTSKKPVKDQKKKPATSRKPEKKNTTKAPENSKFEVTFEEVQKFTKKYPKFKTSVPLLMAFNEGLVAEVLKDVAKKEKEYKGDLPTEVLLKIFNRKGLSVWFSETGTEKESPKPEADREPEVEVSGQQKDTIVLDKKKLSLDQLEAIIAILEEGIEPKKHAPIGYGLRLGDIELQDAGDLVDKILLLRKEQHKELHNGKGKTDLRTYLGSDASIGAGGRGNCHEGVEGLRAGLGAVPGSLGAPFGTLKKVLNRGEAATAAAKQYTLLDSIAEAMEIGSGISKTINILGEAISDLHIKLDPVTAGSYSADLYDLEAADQKDVDFSNLPVAMGNLEVHKNDLTALILRLSGLATVVRALRNRVLL